MIISTREPVQISLENVGRSQRKLDFPWRRQKKKLWKIFFSENFHKSNCDSIFSAWKLEKFIPKWKASKCINSTRHKSDKIVRWNFFMYQQIDKSQPTNGNALNIDFQFQIVIVIIFPIVDDRHLHEQAFLKMKIIYFSLRDFLSEVNWLFQVG